MRSAIGLALVLVSCGRPATTEECEEIVERIAELELKEVSVTNAEDIEDHVRETKHAFEKKTLDQCVGRRITDEALRCVRNAKTAEEIVSECFD